PPRTPMPDLTDAWYEGRWRVALLPGSRPAEIHGHTRAMVAAARAIQDRWPDSLCTFAALSEVGADLIRRECRRGGAEQTTIAVGRQAAAEVLSEANFAIA